MDRLSFSCYPLLCKPLRILKRALLPLALTLGILACATAQPLRVTLLNPDPPGDPFWDLLVSFMQASADDLGVQLKIINSEPGNRFKSLQLARQELSAVDKPDYFVTLLLNRVAPLMIEEAEKRGVKFFSVNSDLSRDERKKLGEPRERYKSWIGKMSPDDSYAGYLLGKKLIEKAREKNLTDKQHQIQIIAIAGEGGLRFPMTGSAD
ncbi:type 1 periplasmic-binding domain-containing protein [Dongshaea marina]|uniref:hypothetical protein n=1 Tax=Dongshaea marina TaxID=2047966 RepID=UPI000D3E8B68|nr:hypothetical protein [Dongshaea marina]